MARRRLTATLVATLILCLLAGGAGAYFLGRQRPVATAVAETPPLRHTVTRTTVITAGPGTDSGTSADPQSTGGNSTIAPVEPPSDSAGSVPSVSTTSGPSDDDTEVQLSDEARKDPQARQVQDLLQRHFDAINSRDYLLWAGTVSPDQAKAIPQTRWAREYSTTKDTGVTIIGIDRKPRQARLTFRSRQQPEFAPDQKSTCTDWSVVFPLTDSSGTLLIGRSNESLARWTPCDD